MPPYVRAVAAALLLFTAACGGDTDGPRTAGTWTVDSVPMVVIGDDDTAAEPVLGVAEGVTRLPDGQLLVADRGLNSLRFFTPDGTFLRAVGRKGSGPGEFEYIANAYRCGDSLYVEEIARRQIMVYALNGEPARTPDASEFAGGRSAYNSACNADGVFMHNGWASGREPTLGRVRWTVPYWIASADGVLRAELGEHAGSERLVMQGGSGPHPLGKDGVLAIGRERAYIGTADSFAVLAFTLDGAPAGVLRNTDVDLRTTAADIARYKRYDTLGVNDRERASRMREWESFEFPPTVPAYDAMLVDALDHLWVRRFPRGDATRTEWLVFDPAGRQVAAVPLPDVLQVHEIGRDYIAGIETDPLDGTQSVRVYGLRRGAP